MILGYGNYRHDLAEVDCAISRSTIRSDQTQTQLGYRETWTINGRLKADTQALLTAKIQALETAYQTDGRDLVLFLPDGTTESAHKIVSSNTLYGTQVSGISYPDGRNAEYSTFRNYQIVVEAEILYFPNANSTFVFAESFSYTGTGGSRFVVREMRNGPPVTQQVSAQTPVSWTQVGSASSRTSFPAASPPIDPGSEQQERRQVGRSTNTSEGRTTFTTSWSYSFLSADYPASGP